MSDRGGGFRKGERLGGKRAEGEEEKGEEEGMKGVEEEEEED